MIKLTKRILIIVGLVALLAIPLLVFFISSRSNSYDMNVNQAQTDQEYADDFVERFEDRYNQVLEIYGSIPDTDYWSKYELNQVKYQYELAAELRDSNPKKLRLVYISSLLNTQANAQAILDSYESIMNSDMDDIDKEFESMQFLNYVGVNSPDGLESQITLSKQAIESGQLEDYIEFNAQTSSSNYGSSYSEETIAKMQELWRKVKVDEATLYDTRAFSQVEQTIDSYIQRLEGLKTGTLNSELMTPQLEARATREMQIILYQIEHPGFMNANTGINQGYFYSQLAATTAFNNSFTFVFMILMIGMMILAASTVSQEIETGTIKALIISPTKRYKIILAKFVALVIVALILFMISIAWIAILSFAFFGAGSLPGMILTLGSDVIAFGPVAAAFVRMFVCFVQVIVFIIIGMTLSTTMRHTAMAVGISIGLFFANMIAQLILLSRRFSETMRLLPFLNIDFSGRISASIPDMLMSGYGQTHYIYMPLMYSVVYTLIFSFLLLWITFDSFIRRDI